MPFNRAWLVLPSKRVKKTLILHLSIQKTKTLKTAEQKRMLL